VICNNVSPIRYTCPDFLNAMFNFGMPLNLKVYCIARNYQRLRQDSAPCNYFARPLTNAVLPFAEILRLVIQ
jgi:hypothetical protein